MSWNVRAIEAKRAAVMEMMRMGTQEGVEGGWGVGMGFAGDEVCGRVGWCWWW